MLHKDLVSLFSPHVKVKHSSRGIRGEQAVPKMADIEGKVVFELDIKEVRDLLVLIGRVHFLWRVEEMEVLPKSL